MEFFDTPLKTVFTNFDYIGISGIIGLVILLVSLIVIILWLTGKLIPDNKLI